LDAQDVEQLRIWGGDDLGRKALEARQAALSPPPAPPLPTSRPAVATKSCLSDQAIDEIAHAVVEFVGEVVVPIYKRLDRLEQQPPSPHYAGTYDQAKRYSRGALVTRSGGLWLATIDTLETPGRSEHWRLVVKSGEAPR
jgi:hypothetical protein